MSKVLSMSSVKDVKNLSAGDLMSKFPEETPYSASILFLSLSKLLQVYFLWGKKYTSFDDGVYI